MTNESSPPLNVGSNDLLGPVPEPSGFSCGNHNGALFSDNRRTAKNFSVGARLPTFEWYSAQQMREYALSAVAAERERCAMLCERYAEGIPDGADDGARMCAAMLRRA